MQRGTASYFQLRSGIAEDQLTYQKVLSLRFNIVSSGCLYAGSDHSDAVVVCCYGCIIICCVVGTKLKFGDVERFYSLTATNSEDRRAQIDAQSLAVEIDMMIV